MKDEADEGTRNVSDALAQLIEGGERERRLVVRVGTQWQVLSVDAARKELVHLSAKSVRLPEPHKLNVEQAGSMRELGFTKNKTGGDWQRTLPAHRARTDRRALAAEMLRIPRELHRLDAHMSLDLEIDDREHPENPELVAAMRKLAGPKKDEADRHAMYNAMCNASFLVLADAGAPPSADPQEAMATIGQLRAKAVYAAFTDIASLRAYAPLERDYLPFHGSELFELLEELDAGSLQVNPEGLVGGELYAHEIGALAEGVRRFMRKRMN